LLDGCTSGFIQSHGALQLKEEEDHDKTGARPALKIIQGMLALMMMMIPI